MPDIYVQLNEDGNKIISYFTNPQDKDFYPNQGVVSASDEMWKEYYDSQPPGFIKDGMPMPE